MQVGLTFDANQTSQEVRTEVAAVVAALKATGHEPVIIGHARDLIDKLAANQRYDLVFNLCRGGLGDSIAPRDTAAPNKSTTTSMASVPAILNLYEIAYTFSDPTCLCGCTHRGHMKSMLRERGVPTSDYWMVETLDDLRRVDSAYPATASPACACPGSPSDDGQIDSAAELSKVCCRLMSESSQAVLIEPCLTGEISVVSVLGGGANAQALTPERAAESQSSTAARTALAAWRVMGGVDAGCVWLQNDSDGVPQVVRIQPLPDLHPQSPLVTSAASVGIAYADLISRILDSACQRAAIATSERLTPRPPHLVSSGQTVGSERY
ncbi:MAG: hypothetical protein IT423_14395 [Pirellulaceae bacterium]|nr:hypothetical protein [Pirellulaceae bacterium]